MRTRFPSPLSPRAARTAAPSNSALDARLHGPAHSLAHGRTGSLRARRLGLALAASVPLCAGALLANPAQAAPAAESDENGPLVQILQPGYNDVLKGKARILIQVTARKYNPQSVEMFIDDKPASTGPLAISSLASSSYDFPTGSWPDGRHKLTIRVTDTQGFRGWAETTIFINNKGVVDTQAPDLRWVGIEPFQEVSGSMKIEVSAADNFGVKMLKISINPVDTGGIPYSWFINQPPYRVNLDTVGKNIPDGLYVLKALAFDSLDQQGEAPPLTIGILNNQINATRVEEMLDGRRQMRDILEGKKPTESAPAQAAAAKTAPAAATTPAATAPAKAAPAATPAPSTAYATAPTPAAPATTAPTTLPQASAPIVADAASARSSVPTTQTSPVPSAAAPATSGQSAPDLLPPTRTVPQQTNPGIQLPHVKTPAAPAIATPRAVPPSAAPAASETRIAELAPAETAPATSEATETAPTSTQELSAPTEVATTAAPEQTATATAEAPQTPAESSATDASATDASATETPIDATAAAPATETVVAQAPVVSDKTYVAAIPRVPVGQRNAGEARLSRAAAVDLAVAPVASIVAAPRTAPIEVARFSQPRLSGRVITGAPVWSQSATNPEARLSNAELSRVRSDKTRVLGTIRPLSAPAMSPIARALQTSAPAGAQRPILGRAISADSVSTPASKLTREARKVAPVKAGSAPSGTLSKAVGGAGRLAPLDAGAFAPVTTEAAAKPVAPRGAMSKAAPAQGRAKPIEVAPVAPARVAKNNAVSAPQLSAAPAPRMSESASGLGVPTKQSGAALAPVAVASRNGERVAALPRPGAVARNRSMNGASIVAVPLDGSLQTASETSVPTSYRAEGNTTLRDIATKFGLPVELVAISNGWTSEMKVLRGMEVKLPRPLEVSYNGVPVKGDAPSMLMGDTAVTAFRFMFEKTGGKLEWDAKNQRVVARKDGREITLTIGSNVARVGEREVAMEIAAFLFQGRTMVPLRFFEEGMNAQVEWNPQTGRLVVAMAG